MIILIVILISAGSPGIDNLKKQIIEYLKTTHWKGSPWTIFSDKRGKVWKATWSDLDKQFVTDYNTLWNIYADSSCGAADKNAYCPFRGWKKGSGNSEWKVRELDLINIDGYDSLLPDGHQPNHDSDSDEHNYRSADDRHNFETIDKYQRRKPPQLTDGVGKPTYIPGYKMLSYSNGKDNNNTFNFLTSDRCGSCRNQAFILFQLYNDKSTYANDVYDNHPDLIKKIINSKFLDYLNVDDYFHTDLVNNQIKALCSTIGHTINKWTDDPWKNSIVNLKVIKSAFTNKKIILSKKSNFLSKINNALPYNTQGRIVENFINPICNLTNILKDPNCSGVEYDTYKQYVTSMDNYCNKNPLLPICTSYITKEIVSLEDPTNVFKINEENKIKILTKQDSLCSDQANYLHPRCILINSKKPEIIQKQILEINRESPLYKQLATNYGNEIDYQTCLIGNNIIETHKDMCQKLEKDSATYGTKLKNKRLEVCKQDTNLFHKSCIELNKLEQFSALTNFCAQDKNLLQKECIELNKIHKLKEVKEQCKNNKTDNCKQLCKEYKEDFNDICFWENNQIYFILAFIALIIIGSLIGYFKFKNRNTPPQNSQQVLALPVASNTQPYYADAAYMQPTIYAMPPTYVP